MKWLKSYWLPLSVLALLVMVDVNFPASHALFPLALVMWFEYAAFSLVCFAGLYSCTLTGSDRLSGLACPCCQLKRYLLQPPLPHVQVTCCVC